MGTSSRPMRSGAAPSRWPDSGPAQRRSANSSERTSSDYTGNAWRSSAPSSRPTARNGSSTPAGQRTDSSAAHWSGRGSRRCERSNASGKSSPSSRPGSRSRFTDAERQALGWLARDLPRLWDAKTTTPRDRKQLLRTLICDVLVTVKQHPRRAEVEIIWEGGARTELRVPLNQRGPEPPPHQ
jgi:hypothetical protein